MAARDSISSAISAAASQGRPALVGFLTAGFPSRESFKRNLAEVASACDVVEIGVPFSDPMADGSTIQRASFAALGNGTGPSPIVGTYMAKLKDFGAVKFLPDGSIVASNGAHGTWTLFDAGSGIYSVVLGGARLTLTLAPGRGLVDSGTRNLYFELQH